METEVTYSVKMIQLINSLCFLSLVFIYEAAALEMDKFPDDFLLGYATASYQIEGAWNEDGKGENIWDRLTHSRPDMIKDGSNADVAADSYHKYKEDVLLLKNLEAQVYRFSLSWSRILPTGDIDVINQAGICYYHSLIDELHRNGIEPMITLYHWDLPQPLQDIGGWANPLMADYFEEYARVAFREFGNKVKWWLTFNEPLQSCLNGYGGVLMAPALNKTGVAEYLCTHTVLLSHAKAYHVYNNEFRHSQNGKIGIALDGGWNEPLSDTAADRDAAETRMQFEFGWFAHPIILGDYPAVMRKNIDANSKTEGRRRSRLPVFDNATLKYVKGTIDYLGVNHYTTVLTSSTESPIGPSPSWDRDVGVKTSVDPSWPGSAVGWLKVVPWGFRKQLNWIKKEYNNIPVIVTENGYGDSGETNDFERINYYMAYIREMLKAVHEDKCNVFGYIAWSLMDNFEWMDGYTARFGIYRVDFEFPNRPRLPKASVEFFKKMYSSRQLPKSGTDSLLVESNIIPKYFERPEENIS